MPKLRNIAKLNYADMHEGRTDTHDDEEEELKLNEATGGDDTIEDDSFTKTNTTPMPNNNKIVADTKGKKLKRAEYLTYLKKTKEKLMQEKEIKNIESEFHNLTLDLNDEGHVTHNRYENERQQQTGFTFKTQRDYRNTDQDHVTL